MEKEALRTYGWRVFNKKRPSFLTKKGWGSIIRKIRKRTGYESAPKGKLKKTWKKKKIKGGPST